MTLLLLLRMMRAVMLSLVPDYWVVEQVERDGVELTFQLDAFAGRQVVRLAASYHPQIAVIE